MQLALSLPFCLQARATLLLHPKHSRVILPCQVRMSSPLTLRATAAGACKIAYILIINFLQDEDKSTQKQAYAAALGWTTFAVASPQQKHTLANTTVN